MELGLRGKKALITGASKGIGRACAEVLAEEGCDVALVSRTAADLDKARSEITTKHNVGVRVFALDLSDGRNVDKLAAECADIDILVNNAGAIPGGNLDAVTEDRWREAWDLKVFGYVNMTRRFYAQMRERGHGVIVNILGSAGENPDVNYIAGSSGNASLMAFTRAMGGAAPRDNLRVVGINPGPVLTERLITLTKTRARRARRRKPLGRADEGPRLWPGRQARGDRLDDGLCRLRSGVGLHHRLDHHHRRRRHQPAQRDLTAMRAVAPHPGPLPACGGERERAANPRSVYGERVPKGEALRRVRGR